MLDRPTQIIRLPNAWNPRKYQLASWRAWRSGIKRELLVWHRRAGKDDVQMHKIAVAAHPSQEHPNTNARIANYWHCLPQFDQARRAIWEAVNPHTGKRRIDEAFPPRLRKSTRNDNMTIEFHSGSTYRIVGSDNPDSLVGAAPFGIVFSEWALSNPSVWPYLAPILNENNGWASFVTTPRGRNHVHSMVQQHRNDPQWFVETLTVDDTHQIQRSQIEEDRKTYRAMFGEDAANSLIEQEYWCSFEAAILGAYWGRELSNLERDGHITEVRPDPTLPIYTSWDLGIGDATAIWFWQVSGRELRVVDYYEAHGHGVEHYAEMKHARIKPLSERAGGQVFYDWDHVPHDARVREFGTGRTRIETMFAMGLKPKVVAQHKIFDGINAARVLFPRCYFDAVACEHGLERLRQYRADWDDDKKVFRDQPFHDWTSHGADAWRYTAMAYREMTPSAEPEKPRALQVGQVPPDARYGQVTLDDVWGSAERTQRRI